MLRTRVAGQFLTDKSKILLKKIKLLSDFSIYENNIFTLYDMPWMSAFQNDTT